MAVRCEYSNKHLISTRAGKLLVTEGLQVSSQGILHSVSQSLEFRNLSKNISLLVYALCVKVLVYVHTETHDVEKPRNLCFLFRPFGNKSTFVLFVSFVCFWRIWYTNRTHRQPFLMAFGFQDLCTIFKGSSRPLLPLKMVHKYRNM